MIDPEKYRAYVARRKAQRALAIKQWRESLKERRALQAKQRQLKAQYRLRARVRKGRLGASVLEDFSQAQLDKRIRLLGGRCIYCGGVFQHLDHLMPVACGGKHAIWNLAPSCRTCNTSKGDSDPMDWVTRRAINKTAALIVERAVRRHMRRANA